mgnify:CR=1 FL=1
MASPLASVLSIPSALEAIRKRYDQLLGAWRPQPGMLWSSIPARPVVWGIDEISQARREHAVGAQDPLHQFLLQRACQAMDDSMGSLCVLVTSLEFRPDYLTTVRSGRHIVWLPLGPIDVSSLWQRSHRLQRMVDANETAKRFLLDCGGHPRTIALAIRHLIFQPGSSYDELFASLFAASSPSSSYRLWEFSDKLDLDALAPCILGLYQDFDPLQSISTVKRHRERLHLNSTSGNTSLLQIPFTSPIFVLQACKLKRLTGYVGLERAIFPLLEQYFELGTSLESRAKLSVDQPAWGRFERAVLLREMLVRLFLHYQRGKNEVSAESTVPVRLEDLYGIPLNPVTRSLPRHSAALNSSDIALDVRQTSGILDLGHKMPLRPADFTGKHFLSTAIKCVSNQDGMDALFVDRVSASTSSSVKYHELLIDCKWSAQGGSLKFSAKDMLSKLHLVQEQDGRGER